jgi:hypothetical protein
MAADEQMKQTQVSFRNWVTIRSFPAVCDLEFHDRFEALEQAISIRDFEDVVAFHFLQDKKTTDADKIFPREVRLLALATELQKPGTDKPEGFDKKQTSGNEQWKYYTKKNFQLSFSENCSATGINQRAGFLYQAMAEAEQMDLRSSWIKSGRNETYYQAPVTALENAYVDYIKAHIRGKAENHAHRGRDDTFEQLKLGISSSFKKDLLKKLSEKCPSCMSRVEKAKQAAEKANPKRKMIREEKKRKAEIDIVGNDDDSEYRQASPTKKRVCSKKSPLSVVTPPQVPIQNGHLGVAQPSSNFFNLFALQSKPTGFYPAINGFGQWHNQQIINNNAANIYCGDHSGVNTFDYDFSGADPYSSNPHQDNEISINEQISLVHDLEQFNKSTKYPEDVDPALLNSTSTPNNLFNGNSENQPTPAAQPTYPQVDPRVMNESPGGMVAWVCEDSYPDQPFEITETTNSEPVPKPNPPANNQSEEYIIYGSDQTDMAQFDANYFKSSTPTNCSFPQTEAEQVIEPQPEVNDNWDDPDALFDEFINWDNENTTEEFENASSDTQVPSPDSSAQVPQQPSFAIDPSLALQAEAEAAKEANETEKQTSEAHKKAKNPKAAAKMERKVCGKVATRYVRKPPSMYGNWKPRTGTNLTLPQVPPGPKPGQF